MQDGNIFQKYLIDNKKEKTLIFIHGFMGSHKDWFDIIEKIGNQFNYILIDLPGHGLNRENLIGWKKYLVELNKIINQEKRVALIGYSMGGRSILPLLNFLPEQVEEVILESVGYGIESSEEKKIRLASDQSLLDQVKSMEPFLNSWYQMGIFGKLNKSTHYSSMISRRMDNNLNSLGYTLDQFSLGRQLNFQLIIESIQTPLLYLVGGNDLKYKKFSLLLKTSDQLQVDEITEASHNTHLEKPDEFIQKIIKFIKS